MSLAVKKVELPSRPDLNLYVRSFSAAEAFDQQAQFKDAAEDGKTTVLMMLSVYVCNEAGERLFPTMAEAEAFIATVKSGLVKKLIKEGQKFNSISDEAVEEELKN